MLNAMLELDHVDNVIIKELYNTVEHNKKLTKEEKLEARQFLLYDDDKLNDYYNKGDD